MAKFLDLPMMPASDILYDFYEAKHVAGYLEKYIDEFKHKG